MLIASLLMFGNVLLETFSQKQSIPLLANASFRDSRFSSEVILEYIKYFLFVLLWSISGFKVEVKLQHFSWTRMLIKSASLSWLGFQRTSNWDQHLPVNLLYRFPDWADHQESDCLHLSVFPYHPFFFQSSWWSINTSASFLDFFGLLTNSLDVYSLYSPLCYSATAFSPKRQDLARYVIDFYLMIFATQMAASE